MNKDKLQISGNLDVRFTAHGLSEKIDAVNAAIEHLHQAQALLVHASQIAVDVCLEDSPSRSES